VIEILEVAVGEIAINCAPHDQGRRGLGRARPNTAVAFLINHLGGGSQNATRCVPHSTHAISVARLPAAEYLRYSAREPMMGRGRLPGNV
jgi:hypothetical protein